MIKFKEVHHKDSRRNFTIHCSEFYKRKYLLGIIPTSSWKHCSSSDVFSYIEENYIVVKYQYTEMFAVRRKYKLFDAHYWDFDVDIDRLFPTRAEALDAIWRRLVKVVRK